VSHLVVDRQDTRSARVALFADECIREVEGHVTAALSVYRAYIAWAVEHEPEGALSDASFRRAFEPLSRAGRWEQHVRGSQGLRTPHIVVRGSEAAPQAPSPGLRGCCPCDPLALALRFDGCGELGHAHVERVGYLPDR
jgi:hypothetical protein